MSYRAEEQTDQNWQGSNKFSPFGYLKYLCFKALYLALVGRHPNAAPAMSIPILSETPGDPPRRVARG
jgi:hypothetical protein